MKNEAAPLNPQMVEVISLTVLLSPPLGELEGTVLPFLLPLHPLVIIPTFLFLLYLIRRERFVTSDFMHIYTICKGQKIGNDKGVCTNATDRVHTVG